MSKQPTYSANEIYKMCTTMQVDKAACDTLSDLLDEELDLYNEIELEVLMKSAIILFTRAALKIHLGL